MRTTVELGSLSAGDERTDVVLVLKLGAVLSGRVLAEAGTPAGGAEVLVFDEGTDREHEAQSDDDGNFRVAGLEAGPFRVWAWSVDAVGDLGSLASVVDVPAGTRDVELRLLRPGGAYLSIRGRTSEVRPRITALDLQGRPAGVRPHPFHLQWRPSMTMHSTSEGFAVEGLEPGEYWLVALAEAEEFRVGRVRILVRAGEVSSAELSLEPATEVYMSLLHGGEPVPGALTVTGDDGFVLRLGPGEEEGLEDEPRQAWLPPGHYRIVGEHDERSATAEVTLSGESWRELALEIR